MQKSLTSILALPTHHGYNQEICSPCCLHVLLVYSSAWCYFPSLECIHSWLLLYSDVKQYYVTRYHFLCFAFICLLCPNSSLYIISSCDPNVPDSLWIFLRDLKLAFLKLNSSFLPLTSLPIYTLSNII